MRLLELVLPLVLSLATLPGANCSSYTTHGWPYYSHIPRRPARSPVACGDVIDTNTLLQNNLFCPGGGTSTNPFIALRVTNGAKLNCQGFGVFGDKTVHSWGILVEDGGTVTGCTVFEFEYGIRQGLGKTIVKGSTINDNIEGGIAPLTLSELQNLPGVGSTLADDEAHHVVEDVHAFGNKYGIWLPEGLPLLTSMYVIECVLSSNLFSGFFGAFEGDDGKVTIRETSICSNIVYGVQTSIATLNLVGINCCANGSDGIFHDGGSVVIEDSEVSQNGQYNLLLVGEKATLVDVYACGLTSDPPAGFDVGINLDHPLDATDLICETVERSASDPNPCSSGCNADGEAAAIQCKVNVPWWEVYRGRDRDHYYCSYDPYH